MKVPVYPCTAWEKDRFIAKWYKRLSWNNGMPVISFVERHTPIRDKVKFRNVRLVFVRQMGNGTGTWINVNEMTGGGG